ncbi:MAG: AMP-binding protein [Burkholderiales bacterium]|nr:AMP-binding protein [Burkholderiales bacterium]
MNAAELLLGGEADAVALIEGARKVSYRELRDAVRQSAAAWRSRGLAPGDVGIVAMLDGIDLVAALLGLMWINAIPAPISPRTEAKQIKELLAESGAKLLLCEDALANELADARILRRSAWLAGLASTRVDAATAGEAKAEAPCFMLFSSGTTGKPKGIVHAHRCVAEAHVFARDVLGATPADRFMSTSKLFFAYPMANSLFAGLRLGASVVLDPGWPNPEAVAILAREHAPTLFFSVPTLYQRLLEAGVDLASVRHFVSAGEACPPALADAWQLRHGQALVNGYGTTETLALMLYRTAEMESFQPTPLTAVREESSDPSDTDASLRLWFSHPSVSLGYTRVVTHDSARFGEQGFSPGDLFRRQGATGDCGWVFTGRSDQMLKVYGRWVDTVALEHWLLAKMPHAIRELSIVPHDADGGTVSLHLFAVSLGGQEDQVRALVRSVCEELPAFKRPAVVHLLGELPRTETGKIRRGHLKNLAHQI